MKLEKITLNASVEELNGKKAIEIAKKKGISVDNPSLAFFSSVLCEIEKVNANKVILAREATEEAVSSLIGCQVNFNHVGKGAICGFIFDSSIKKDQVLISGVFFKKIYSIEYTHAQKLFEKGELTVSYELTHDAETAEKLNNGTKRINDFYFTGAGLLLGEIPACKNAVVYEFAKKMEDQRQEMIFASQKKLNKIVPKRQKNIATILEALISQLHSKEKDIDLVAKFNCECLKCGKTISSDEHCKDIRCPECGGEMRRADRPGSGQQRANVIELFADVKKEDDINFDLAMTFYYALEEEKNQLNEEAKKWTKKFINNLPDSAFAVIEPAYSEQTKDKNARHLPHHDGSGDLGKSKSNINLDLSHLRNALARMNQIKPITDSISAEDLRKKAENHLNRHKDVLEQSEKGGKTIVTLKEIKSKLSEELGELVKDWTDEDFQNEEKIAEARKKKEEQTSEEKKDEKAEKTVVESEEKVVQKTTLDDETKSEKAEVQYEIEVRKDGKVIRTEKSNSEVVYLYAQVESLKADYEKQINELKATLEVKDSEIEAVRKNAEKIAKLKIENENNEFTKEFKNEDWLNAEKLEEAKNLQARKEKIEANKENLKDNEFAKDFTDDDYANDDKVNAVKLQAELKIKDEKIKELEAQIPSEETKDEKAEEEIAKETKDDLETNHKEDVTSKEEKTDNALVGVLKNSTYFKK